MTAAETANPENPVDFMADDILYCGACQTPKQCRIEILGVKKTVPCLCKCRAEKYNELCEQENQAKEQQYISQLKSQGIQDRAIRYWTFDNDDNNNPAMTDKAMRYYTKWRQMYKENIGLLLWGNVGTGKTFFAACIANALINIKVPVLMTNFAKIINAMHGFAVEDKNKYIDSLNHYRLLIIDDLGAERQSEFAQEIVYNVIDSRYKSGKPLIITTNMTIDEIKTPKNISYSRIYDRIMEMCVPIEFKGESRRRSMYQEKLNKARAMFE